MKIFVKNCNNFKLTSKKYFYRTYIEQKIWKFIYLKENVMVLLNDCVGAVTVGNIRFNTPSAKTIHKICCSPKSYCIAQGSIFKIL